MAESRNTKYPKTDARHWAPRLSATGPGGFAVRLERGGERHQIILAAVTREKAASGLEPSRIPRAP